MTLNPDDLLIFKEREEELEKKKEKKQKAVPAKPEAKPEPAPKQQPGQQKAVEPAAPQIAEPVTERAPPMEVPAGPVPAQEAEEIPVPSEVPQPTAPELKIKTKNLRAKESRKLASKMNCVIHPWRQAYAICDFCKRPFCYEDIMEYNGSYYCLDDIDKVSQEIRASLNVRYTRLSVMSSTMFFLVLLVFIYSQSGVIAPLISGTLQYGPSIYGASGSGLANLLAAASLLAAVLSFISGVMVIMSAHISFRVSAISGLFTVALFSYQYLNNGNLFYGAISALSFIGLVSLAYSRVATETLPEEDMLTSDVVSPLEFSNTRGI